MDQLLNKLINLTYIFKICIKDKFDFVQNTLLDF